MVAFTTTLQADLSGTSFGGAPTWTDLTRFARLKASPVTINAWRQDELSDVAPSTATITLDNADLPGDVTAPNAGRFTPDLATSPFYPRIVPGVRMRFGVTVNGTTYWLIDGYVDSWDASAIDGEFPICVVVVNDILARFGDSTPLQNLFVEETALDSPLAQWPLTDASGATAAGNIATITQPALTVAAAADVTGGDATFGNAAGIPADAATTLSLNTSLTSSAADDLKGYYLTGPTLPALGTAFTVEAWIRLDPNLAAAMSRYTQGPTAIPVPIACIYDNSGNVVGGIAVWYTGGTVRAVNFTSSNWPGFSVSYGTGPYINLNDGKLHHVVFVANGASGILYVDGNASSPVAFNAVAAGNQLVVGGPSPRSGFYGQAPLFRGTMEYVAVYPTALSAARVSAHLAAGATTTAGERTDVHVTRLLSYRTNLGSALDTGNGSVGVHQTAGVTLQQALIDTGKAEGGFLYADGSCRVVLLRRSRLRNPAVAATLDIGAQQTGETLRVRKDRQQMVNDATITRTFGATQRVVDITSQASDGPRVKSDTLIVATDNDALNAAGWLVANGKTARLRVAELPVDLLTEPSLTVAQAVLALAPLSRVALTNPPGSLPSVDVIVQGVQWTVGVDVFEAAFYTSPLPRPTLRFDAAASAFTKLDSGNVFAW